MTGLVITEIRNGLDVKTNTRVLHLRDYRYGFVLSRDHPQTFEEARAGQESEEMIYQWIRERFGELGQSNDVRFISRTYWFRHPRDAMEFKLRWL
jgi:hypothetical protein